MELILWLPILIARAHLLLVPAFAHCHISYFMFFLIVFYVYNITIDRTTVNVYPINGYRIIEYFINRYCIDGYHIDRYRSDRIDIRWIVSSYVLVSCGYYLDIVSISRHHIDTVLIGIVFDSIDTIVQYRYCINGLTWYPHYASWYCINWYRINGFQAD